jgi:electron transfer flavoprotein beta subunit
VQPDGSVRLIERMEGGRHQVSVCQGPPLVVGWATGYLPEPPNNPQVGMANMRTIMPALQKAKAAALRHGGVSFARVEQPTQVRTTKVVKDWTPDEIARDIVAWMRGV